MGEIVVEIWRIPVAYVIYIMQYTLCCVGIVLSTMGIYLTKEVHWREYLWSTIMLNDECQIGEALTADILRQSQFTETLTMNLIWAVVYYIRREVRLQVFYPFHPIICFFMSSEYQRANFIYKCSFASVGAFI